MRRWWRMSSPSRRPDGPRERWPRMSAMRAASSSGWRVIGTSRREPRAEAPERLAQECTCDERGPAGRCRYQRRFASSSTTGRPGADRRRWRCRGHAIDGRLPSRLTRRFSATCLPRSIGAPSAASAPKPARASRPRGGRCSRPSRGATGGSATARIGPTRSFSPLMLPSGFMPSRRSLRARARSRPTVASGARTGSRVSALRSAPSSSRSANPRPCSRQL